MEAMQIILRNGDTALADRLGAYFDTLFDAERSGDAFPANLEHVWKIGFLRKDHAVRALRKKFVEGVDYQVFLKVGENPLGGRPEEIFKLTVSCLEYFAVRANREVFEVYRKCRQAITKLVMPSYPEALRMLAEKVEREETLVRELNAARPAVETMQALTDSGEALDMGEVAKTLAIPGLGRNNLYDLLREASVIRPAPSTEPYQQYVDCGYFKRVQVPYEAKGEQRLGGKTLATPRGITFIRNLIARRTKAAA